MVYHRRGKGGRTVMECVKGEGQSGWRREIGKGRRGREKRRSGGGGQEEEKKAGGGGEGEGFMKRSGEGGRKG